jgi:hypothetical protein
MGMEKESGGPLRIVLDLEPGAEPITGTIASGSRPRESFAGVMQLVAALDRLRDQTAASPMPVAIENEQRIGKGRPR